MIDEIYKKIVPISIVLYLIGFLLGWPLYIHIFDTDGVAYASIAEQYASGHYKEAVNAFWSPLHSWIIVPFLKLNISAVYLFKFSNALISAGILYLFNKHLEAYLLDRRLHIAAMLTVIVILLHYTWFELAADLLVVFFLYMYFLIVASSDFYSSRKKNMYAGAIGALAYFAKTYVFLFFIFHYSFLHLWLNRRHIRWDLFIYGIGIFLFISFFWIYTLYLKFNSWMFGVSGLLNVNWFLNATPIINTALDFYPVPHRFAFSSWEDPWYNSPVQHSRILIFESYSTWLHIFRMLLYNFQKWLLDIFHFSFLAPAIIFVMAMKFLYKKTLLNYLYIFLFFGYSAGYILLHSEPRYIWVITFFLLIAGIGIVNEYTSRKQFSKFKLLFIWMIFFGSFLIEPVNQLKDSMYKQKELYDLAAQLKIEGLNDSFASNKNIDECMIIAYLNKVQYLTPVSLTKDFFYHYKAAKSQGISSFLFFYDNSVEKTAILSHVISLSAQKINEIQPGVIWIKF